MRVSGVLAVVVGLGLVVPAAASAQSLAELAAKEKQRREKLKKDKPEAKTFSEDDLYKARVSGARIGDETVSANPSSASPEAGEAEGEAEGQAEDGEAAAEEKTQDELRAEEEAAWRAQLTAAETERQKLDAEIASVQRALNDNTVNMYGSARQSRLNRLEEAKAMKAETEQRIAALEQEGRRKRFRR